MSDRLFTPEQIDSAITGRFVVWTNFLRRQQASPVVCIAAGHVGDRRTKPELVLCLPDTIDLDWGIEALEATLETFRAEKARRG